MTSRLIGVDLTKLSYSKNDAMIRASSRSSFHTCAWFDHPLYEGTHSKGLFRACKFDSLQRIHFIQVSFVHCRAWLVENCSFYGVRVHLLFVKTQVVACRFELSLIQHLSSRGVQDSVFELCRIRMHPQENSVWEGCHFIGCDFERIGQVLFRNCTFDGCRFPAGENMPPAAQVQNDTAS